jgi:RNase P protein component
MENNKELTAMQEHIAWLKKQIQECIDNGDSISWIYAYEVAIKHAEIMLDVEKKKIKEAVWRNLPIEDGVTTAVQKAEQYYEKTYGDDKQ